MNIMTEKWDVSGLPRKCIGEEFYPIVVKWTNSKYDGPLSGMCSCDNKEYWFQLFFEDYCVLPSEEDDDPNMIRIRAYHLIDLTNEQKEFIERIHKLFLQYVEKMTDSDSTVQMYEEFSEEIRGEQKAVILPEQIVGWFEENSIKRASIA